MVLVRNVWLNYRIYIGLRISTQDIGKSVIKKQSSILTRYSKIITRRLTSELDLAIEALSFCFISFGYLSLVKRITCTIRYKSLLQFTSVERFQLQIERQRFYNPATEFYLQPEVQLFQFTSVKLFQLPMSFIVLTKMAIISSLIIIFL